MAACGRHFAPVCAYMLTNYIWERHHKERAASTRCGPSVLGFEVVVFGERTRMETGEVRRWRVRSNSFRPDYEITGVTLPEALQADFRRIAADALPREGGWRPMQARAEWQPDILRGRGGVELRIKARARDTEAVSSYLVWISAAPSELRAPLDLALPEAPAK